MPYNLLLLPLLGGYWFIHNLHYTGFRSQRLDGYRLLLESALAGVGFVLLAQLLSPAAVNFPVIRQIWLQFAPNEPYLGVASASLLLGVIAPYIVNGFLSLTGLLTKPQAQLKAINHHGNHLLRLIHAAVAEERTVSITLDNRKVYIGLIADAPNLEPHETFLMIIPFLSGYRDDRLELILTVDYLSVAEKQNVDLKTFRIALPISSIRMASFFDEDVYPAFLIEAAPAES